MEDFAKFKNIAIRFLSYRPRTEKEVRDKLLQFANKKSPRHSGKRSASRIDSGVADTPQNDNQIIIEKVIAFLKEHKFVNDEEFVAFWIRQRTEINKKSLKVIALELRQKGVDKEIIDRMIHDSKFVIQTDLERAKILIAKKIDKYKGVSQYELLQKLGPYLARRGFDYDTIKEAIGESIDEVGQKDV